MSKSKTKRKTVSKEIRTDVWELSATQDQKHQMILTVVEYRRYLTPLVFMINDQWCNLAEVYVGESSNGTSRKPITVDTLRSLTAS